MIYFLHFLGIHSKIEGTIKFFTIFKTKFRQLLARYHLLAPYLHGLLKYVVFSWKIFCPNELLGFADQYVLKMFMNFSFTKLKVEYVVFESLSLKPMHDTGDVY